MENITRRQALLGLAGLAGVLPFGEVVRLPKNDRDVWHIGEAPHKMESHPDQLQPVSVILGDISCESNLPIIKALIFARPSVRIEPAMVRLPKNDRDVWHEAVWEEFPLLVIESDSIRIFRDYITNGPLKKFSVAVCYPNVVELWDFDAWRTYYIHPKAAASWQLLVFQPNFVKYTQLPIPCPAKFDLWTILRTVRK